MRQSKRYLTRHHLVPKERVKLHTEAQDQSYFKQPRLLMLWRDHHVAWHQLFGNMTLREIIRVLQRIERLKYFK